MKARLAVIASLAVLMTACRSAPEESSGPYFIGVGSVDYDSLYRFGYNTGCRSAGYLKQNPGADTLEGMKDKVLDGLSEFDKGWNAGIQACQDGVSRSMYMVKGSSSKGASK
ncbi:hypothetical protein [Shewanella sp. Isolate7]|uniref:hypothetical protein n=1 Tax=Shewanella sp. Isolate7 TaxID=2908528 RepID=UPI001EFE9CBD|nr:hypothetical protein [Shewanella sp. Isolate7]MCG9720514.1 hypothetical protein [Shewanella sp. Isolate7]